MMQMIVQASGDVICLYDETIDLSSIGTLVISRASHVEPDERGRWWADLGPVNGPRLGPFHLRSEALSAERSWLDGRW
jgi:hypothetical protein